MTPAEASLEVRPAVRADLLAVYRIEKEAFPQPWPFGAFERFLDAPGFLVADPSGEREVDGVVGYVVADVVPTRSQPMGHVKDIAVHPEFRGRGVGEALLRRALGALAAEGAQSVKLEVRTDNEPARSLYRKYGFDHRRTLPGYYDDGEDADVLVRDLSRETFPRPDG